MSPTSAHHDRTRERLMTAAERLFAERGFRQVTVRDICREARANVAAVNYHFGDKLGLYREIMQVAILAMQDATNAAREAGAGQPPEEQLRRYVSLFLRRLLATGQNTIHKLIDREMSEPTAALDDLVRDGMRPRLEYLCGIVSAMLQRAPTDRTVFLCVMSIQSQTIMYARSGAVAGRLGFSGTPSPSGIDEIAHHITEFSLAGIRNARTRGDLENPRRTPSRRPSRSTDRVRKPRSSPRSGRADP
jgi:AcrR family transcriptional regulator